MKKLILLAALLLSACGTETKQESVNQDDIEQKGFAVHVSIDDYLSLESILKYLPVFNSYGVTFTYYASQYQSDQKWDLLYLQSMGHSIGNHTQTHTYAPTHVKNTSVDEYVKYIMDYNDKMKNDGLEVVKFAYPYGAGVSGVDSIISGYFEEIRYTTKDYLVAVGANKIGNTSFPKSVIIDSYNFDKEKLEEALLKASTSKQDFYLFFHAITDEFGNEYHIKPDDLIQTLELISKYQ